MAAGVAGGAQVECEMVVVGRDDPEDLSSNWNHSMVLELRMGILS